MDFSEKTPFPKDPFFRTRQKVSKGLPGPPGRECQKSVGKVPNEPKKESKRCHNQCFPEGPGIEKIRSRPSGLKISSDRSWIEIFDRDLLCTLRGPRKWKLGDWNFRSGLKISIGIEKFEPGLKFSIGIEFFRSQGPLGYFVVPKRDPAKVLANSPQNFPPQN